MFVREPSNVVHLCNKLEYIIFLQFDSIPDHPTEIQVVPKSATILPTSLDAQTMMMNYNYKHSSS